MRKFVKSWVINTAAVLAAVYIVRGIKMDNLLWTPFMVALVLGILNTFIRPVLMFFALPLLLATLGLFTLVINALLLYLVGLLLTPHFRVDTFWSALLGALIISVVSTLLGFLTGGGEARVRVSRRKRPPDGNGPVIDV